MSARQLLFQFLASAAVLSAQTGGGLVTDWRVDASPSAESEAAIAAVCPDGTLYLISRRGDTSTIDRHGNIVRHQNVGVFQRVDAAACGPGDTLYLAGRVPKATRDSLAFVERDRAKYTIAAVVGLNLVETQSMVVVRKDMIALAGFGQAGSLPLHFAAPTGKVLLSFGEGGGPMEPADRALVDGFLLWSNELQHLLFVSLELAEIQVYDAQGNAVTVKAFGLNRPAAFQWEAQERIDEVAGATLLPNGEMLIQALSEASPGPAHLVLCLFNRDFDQVYSEPRNDLGLVSGSDTEGGIYFVRGNCVSRAHFLPGSRKQPHPRNDHDSVVAQARASAALTLLSALERSSPTPAAKPSPHLQPSPPGLRGTCARRTGSCGSC
jgi:hypothetical protein